MFSALHLTLLQSYRFPEPLFDPKKLQPSPWARLRHRQKDYQFFDNPLALVEWIRHGKVITVPSLGTLKPLRHPMYGDDHFYRPFFERWRSRTTGPALSDHPLPFFPLQLIPSENEVAIRYGGDERASMAHLLDLPVRSWTAAPMLVIYPAGAISAQFRLYIELAEPISSAAVQTILENWRDVPCRLIGNARNAQPVEYYGPRQLLDALADRWRTAILGHGQRDLTAERTPISYTVVNMQGSLLDPTTNRRRSGVRTALTRSAGLRRELDQRSALAFWDAEEQIPWLLAGNHTAVLAVDDLIAAHHRERNIQRPHLEARRALRNRTITAIEMGMASRMIFEEYASWLNNQIQQWEIEPLQPRSDRLRNFYRNISLDGRIFGTLLYELAAIEPNLRKADPYNAPFWSQLYAHVLGRAGTPVDAALPDPAVSSIERLVEDMRSLAALYRERDDMQNRSLAVGIEMLSNLVSLLRSLPPGSAAQP